tara:strand:+ start:1638 stop:1766 length:129 start_codon:yes stop_codon:yes gene_type:complete
MLIHTIVKIIFSIGIDASPLNTPSEGEKFDVIYAGLKKLRFS